MLTASHPASVTIAIRPHVERDGEVCLPNAVRKIFFAMGLDSVIRHLGLANRRHLWFFLRP